MPLQVGIVGLPNSGKSTLFNALVGEHLAKVADYPFTTIEPNVGVIAVPDERLARIAELIANSKSETLSSKQTQNSKFQKINIIPATIKFIDIAGLVEGAHQGKGLGNQFLAHIREVDAIVLLVRGFDLPVEPADPAGSAELVKLELKLGGIEKPTLVVENTNVTVNSRPRINGTLQVNAQSGEGTGELIKKAYQLLELITFYTLIQDPTSESGRRPEGVGVQAWPIKQGTTAHEAAGKIHTDFQKGFIKAEVIGFDELIKAGDYQQARAAGKLRFEGRDYLVADGDIVKIRFKV